MTRAITNSADIIDSRDVIARFEELESEREDLADALADVLGGAYQDRILIATATRDLAEWDEENSDELAALKALYEQDYAETWHFGVTLIRDSYFEDFARQEAEDLGLVDDSARWPCTCIDWEQAAREFQMDYTCVDFDGVEYWVRS